MKLTPHSIVCTSGAVAANALLIYVFMIGPTRVLQDAEATRRVAAARRAAFMVRVSDHPARDRTVFSVPHEPQALLPSGDHGEVVMP